MEFNPNRTGIHFQRIEPIHDENREIIHCHKLWQVIADKHATSYFKMEYIHLVEAN